MDKPLTEKDIKLLHNGKGIMLLSDVQSAKRLLKHNQRVDINFFLGWLSANSTKEVYDKAVKDLELVWQEGDACFQIPDGDNQEWAKKLVDECQMFNSETKRLAKLFLDYAQIKDSQKLKNKCLSCGTPVKTNDFCTNCAFDNQEAAKGGCDKLGSQNSSISLLRKSVV